MEPNEALTTIYRKFKTQDDPKTIMELATTNTDNIINVNENIVFLNFKLDGNNLNKSDLGNLSIVPKEINSAGVISKTDLTISLLDGGVISEAFVIDGSGNFSMNGPNLEFTNTELDVHIVNQTSNLILFNNNNNGSIINKLGANNENVHFYVQDNNYNNLLSIDGTGNTILYGDLNVFGTTTTINSIHTTYRDTVIELNSGATTNDKDIGILLNRGGAVENGFIGFDESSDEFIVALTNNNASDSGNLSLNPATLRANNINISSNLNVIGTTTLASGTTIGNLTLADGSITSSSGVISFNNENLSTTGTLASGDTTITGELDVSQTINTENIHIEDSLFLTNNTYQISQGTIDYLGNKDVLKLSTPSNNGIFLSSGSVYTGNLIFQYGQILSTTGSVNFGSNNIVTTGGNLYSGNIILSKGTITSTTGAISFGDENLSTTGTLASGDTTITGELNVSQNIYTDNIYISDNLYISNNNYQISQDSWSIFDTLKIQTPANNVVFIDTLQFVTQGIFTNTLSVDDTISCNTLSVGDTGITGELEVTENINVFKNLNVGGTTTLATGTKIGNLTLGSGLITDSSGSISFGNENLLTTGTLGAGVATLASGTRIDEYIFTDTITKFSGADIKLGENVVITSNYLFLNETSENAITYINFGNYDTTNIESSGFGFRSNDGILEYKNFSGSWADIGSGGGTTINNNANNRIITGSDTEGTLEAESTLTYDGTDFKINTDKFIVNSSTGDTTITGELEVSENITVTKNLVVSGTTTLATGSTIGNLTLANGSITDSSGSITFGNENLSTTGTLASGNTTITGELDVSETIHTENLHITDNLFLSNNTYQIYKDRWNYGGLGLSVYDTLTFKTPGNNAIFFDSIGIISNGITSNTLTVFGDINSYGTFDVDGNAIIQGYLQVDQNLIVAQNLNVSGTTTLATGTAIGNLTLGDGSITDSSGSISFGNENLSTTGTFATDSLFLTNNTYQISQGSWAGILDTLTIQTPSDNGVFIDTASFITQDIYSNSITIDGDKFTVSALSGDTDIAGELNVSENITVTKNLNVSGTTTLASGTTIGNLTLADSSITASSGSISFGNENLSTTGTLASGNTTITGELDVSQEINTENIHITDSLFLTNNTYQLSQGSWGGVLDTLTIQTSSDNAVFIDTYIIITAGILSNTITVTETATLPSITDIGTLELRDAFIGDVNGSISFGGNNLSTSGTLASGDTTITGELDVSENITVTKNLNVSGTTTLASGTTIGNLTLADSSITASSGSISFGNENLTTTGTLDAGDTTITGTLEVSSLSTFNDNTVIQANYLFLNETSENAITYINFGNYDTTNIESTGFGLRSNDGILQYKNFDGAWANIGSGGGGSTTINNNADNRIITGSDSADTLEAESTLTYDGTDFKINTDKFIVNSSTGDTDISGELSVSENIILTKNLNVSGTTTLASGTTIGNLTLSDGSITASSGSISFDNENLSTTGTLAAGNTTITGELDVSGSMINSFTTNTTIAGASTDVLIDFSTATNFSYNLPDGGDITMVEPLNATRLGQSGNFIIKTGDTGVNDITWADNSHWYFESGVGPSLTATTNVYDIMSYLIVADNTVLITSSGNFSQG